MAARARDEGARGMAGAGTSQWVWWSAALMAVLGLLGLPTLARAQTATQILPLEPDAERGVDRYQIVAGQGSSFWELGVNHLPLLALEQGDLRVIELIERAWRAEYPDRAPNDLRPGDTFVLEVPSGTFVARTYNRQPEQVVFVGFNGDEVTTYPRDPVVLYRLRRAATPDRAEVVLSGGQASAVDEAKRVYGVDPPDFLQVRAVRGALQERNARITVDLTKRYLDEFRNFRNRAVRVEDTPEGLKAHYFDRNDIDVPYVRVDDGVGDETDPGNFPRVFRVAYYRDGTVRRYVITESGDSLGALSRPDSAAWSRVLPSWQEWLTGQPEALPPFTPAISPAGALLPGRILVVAFRPRTVQASPQPSRPGATGGGIDCLGVPLGLIAAAGLVIHSRRPRG